MAELSDEERAELGMLRAWAHGQVGLQEYLKLKEDNRELRKQRRLRDDKWQEGEGDDRD